MTVCKTLHREYVTCGLTSFHLTKIFGLAMPVRLYLAMYNKGEAPFAVDVRSATKGR